MVGMLHVCDMLVSTRLDPIEFDLLTLLALPSRFLRENALPKELLNCNAHRTQIAWRRQDLVKAERK